MVFMSCNLMGGMYQRLEKLRKNAFASMALLEKTTTLLSPVSGCGKDTIWPLNCLQTGRSTITLTNGRNWTPILLRPKRWSTIICAGLAKTQGVENSIRARFLNRRNDKPACQRRVLISNVNLCPSRHIHERVPFFDK